MKIEPKRLNPHQISLNKHNPRKISQKAIDKAKHSISTFAKMFELRPLVVDAFDMTVIGGNTKLLAARELGLEKVPCYIVHGLTDKQRRQFVVKDNVPFGEWDWENLSFNFTQDELVKFGILEEVEVPSELMVDAGEFTFISDEDSDIATDEVSEPLSVCSGCGVPL